MTILTENKVTASGGEGRLDVEPHGIRWQS